MKVSDLNQLPDVKSIDMGRLFTAADAAVSQMLSAGKYKFHPKVKLIKASGNLTRDWQAAILIASDGTAVPISPRTLCGLAFVNGKMTKVNPKSLKGDILKLIEAEAEIEVLGYEPFTVDKYGEEGMQVERNFPCFSMEKKAPKAPKAPKNN